MRIRIRGFLVYPKLPDRKFYASRRINGKLHTVYIGRDTGIAAEKIKAYCERQGIDLNAIPSGESTNRDTTHISVDTNVCSVSISALESEVGALRAENRELRSLVATLTARLEKLEQASTLEASSKRKPVQGAGERVLGFRIHRDKKGHWYGQRYYYPDGKKTQLKAYIGAGEAPEGAEGKIRAYLERKGLTLDEIGG